MMTIDQLTAFFGWMAVLNFGLLFVSTIGLFAFRDLGIRIHQKFMGLSQEDLQRAYFRYLATYKLLVLVFNVIPYVALRLMNS